ncbi:unnamed protein product, partial [Brenthis ino]
MNSQLDVAASPSALRRPSGAGRDNSCGKSLYKAVFCRCFPVVYLLPRAPISLYSADTSIEGRNSSHANPES